MGARLFCALSALAFVLQGMQGCSGDSQVPPVSHETKEIARAQERPVQIAWVGLTRPWSLHLMAHYLASPDPSPLAVRGGRHPILTPTHIAPDPAFDFMGKDVPAVSGLTRDLLSKSFSLSPWPQDTSANVKILQLPSTNASNPNPFLVSDNDFNTGLYLPWPLSQPAGLFPHPGGTDLAWYAHQVASGLAPEVFMIGGHHVISEGYHDNSEHAFIFEPGLFWAVENNAGARAYFDRVKVAILFGCNTLTDLEPHHADGTVMSPAEIKQIYSSSPSGRQAMIGSSREINSLEFYRHRLATEYGPSSREYSYTTSESAEKCISLNPTNCPVANLTRIMPESGLFDGSHRFNEAIKARALFRNAYLVIGFSSASPSEELRVLILQRAVRQATEELKLKAQNVMQVILSDKTPEAERKRAIVALRRAWERASFAMNRHRPSGSITPAYPEIDRGYVMEIRQTHDRQPYAKYR